MVFKTGINPKVGFGKKKSKKSTKVFGKSGMTLPKK